MKRLGLLALLLAVGCGHDDSLFPLKVGSEWSYQVKAGLLEQVPPSKVTREIPVGGVQGFELQGPMGTSWLAWKGGVLIASVLPNARLSPPLPMLVASDPAAKRSWRGRIYAGGKTHNATATLEQAAESRNVGAKKVDCVKATITMNLGGQSQVVLETWYEPGVGPVEQIQRTLGGSNPSQNFDVALNWMRGP